MIMTFTSLTGRRDWVLGVQKMVVGTLKPYTLIMDVYSILESRTTIPYDVPLLHTHVSGSPDPLGSDESLDGPLVY